MKTIVKSVLLSAAIVLSPMATVIAAEDGSLIVERVDINSADADMLAEMLSGVGLTRAKAIIAYRQLHGDFKSAEELAEVKGVSERMVAQNSTRIRLN
ncbi:competence protein ComEA [Sinobacterium caligoides]|uniref:Competence protein ComEA n=1 Tax=Sinobacterium caligoides TaxID=933926 RepID=A0A3N2DZ25_9GAMM|nr:helix-hairpin-helix domain-containing protein [Sinobacterium caligoides]ROS05126.1 competence protein ComEA [Sinobacterium caligoides]